MLKIAIIDVALLAGLAAIVWLWPATETSLSPEAAWMEPCARYGIRCPSDEPGRMEPR